MPLKKTLVAKCFTIFPSYSLALYAIRCWAESVQWELLLLEMRVMRAVRVKQNKQVTDRKTNTND